MVKMRAERQRRGWNQTVLAFRAKVALADVSKFETRRATPYPGQRKRLARALNLDPETLLDEVTEISTPAAYSGS
jgi:ribosome-binding protein aMBF1 (putative translation factor)